MIDCHRPLLSLAGAATAVFIGVGSAKAASPSTVTAHSIRTLGSAVGRSSPSPPQEIFTIPELQGALESEKNRDTILRMNGQLNGLIAEEVEVNDGLFLTQLGVGSRDASGKK